MTKIDAIYRYSIEFKTKSNRLFKMKVWAKNESAAKKRCEELNKDCEISGCYVIDSTQYYYQPYAMAE